jgi:BirA family biotin operon repressor/biotin-[acetyl-CoA-carboxylase] ligase
MSGPAATGSGVIPFADGALDPGRWTVFENVACLDSVPSSNDLAREIIDFYFQEEQDLPATLLVAEEQPAARGRSGREWKAPRGRGLYLTLIRKVLPGEPLSILPLAVARWVREAIRETCGLAPSLKWPNDVYVGRRKLAGILTEARTQGEDAYAAVGIGVNVRGRAEDLGVANATTVEEEAGRPVPLARLLQALVDHADRGLAQPNWEREIEEWKRAALHRRGDCLQVVSGGRKIVGEYVGLDASGFLRLATAAGEETVANGELEKW